MGQPVGLHYHYGTLGQLEQGVEFAEAYLRHLGKVEKGTLRSQSGLTKRVKRFVFSSMGHRNMEGEWAFVPDLNPMMGQGIEATNF